MNASVNMSLFLIYICTHVPGVAAADIPSPGGLGRGSRHGALWGCRASIREKVLDVS